MPTETTWYTGSASFRPNKDFDHPLYPMRGFLGDTAQGHEDPDHVLDVEEQVVFATDGDEDAPVEELDAKVEAQSGPEPYDLVFILDAIYHFPPDLGTFLSSVLPSLRKGSGVIAYTDIIAPPALGKFPGRILANFIATFLRVPIKNLSSGPKNIVEYTNGLRNLGFTNIQVVDWTEHVFPGLANNLRKRGGAWQIVAWLADKAAASGWKYVAVRAGRPA